MIFRERERETEIETESNIDVRNINQLFPTCAPTEDQTSTSVCALTGSRTHNLFVYRRILKPTEQPSQGSWVLFVYTV